MCEAELSEELLAIRNGLREAVEEIGKEVEERNNLYNRRFLMTR